MSKMDGLRAMREARYAKAAAAGAQATRARTPASRPPVAPAERSTEPGPLLCGHRAISGRTCTRERGHSAKSHRYS